MVKWCQTHVSAPPVLHQERLIPWHQCPSCVKMRCGRGSTPQPCPASQVSPDAEDGCPNPLISGGLVPACPHHPGSCKAKTFYQLHTRTGSCCHQPPLIPEGQGRG